MRMNPTLTVFALLGLAAASSPAMAGSYVVNCGTNGDAALVQNQLAAMAGPNNTLLVGGTCVGDVSISNFDSLTIFGLSLTGNLYLRNATRVSMQGVIVHGTLDVDRSSFTVNSSTVNGAIQLRRNSSGTFGTLNVTQGRDPATGAAVYGIWCLQGSDCNFTNTSVSGLPSGDPASPAVGILAATASRLSFASGRVAGFDIGVKVWNNSTAFLMPDCGNLTIESNSTAGVQVRDGGVVKLEGAPPPVSATCPAGIVIANNGSYGLLAEGGGLGFLYRAQVSGHSVDNVKVQNGSIVKIRSSTIGAATGSGRAARLKGNAHLWFDEETNGPSAGSTLAGPVCMTNGSTVDTDNSSTTLTTVSSCP